MAQYWVPPGVAPVLCADEQQVGTTWYDVGHLLLLFSFP